MPCQLSALPQIRISQMWPLTQCLKELGPVRLEPRVYSATRDVANDVQNLRRQAEGRFGTGRRPIFSLRRRLVKERRRRRRRGACLENNIQAVCETVSLPSDGPHIHYSLLQACVQHLDLNDFDGMPGFASGTRTSGCQELLISTS